MFITKARKFHKDDDRRYVAYDYYRLTKARTIGLEAVCRSTLCLLKVREFLGSRGWGREQVDLALMQVIARAIYPFSELKTVRCL